ncbi:MAG: hypothetical protein Q8L88_02345 [Bacteroidota bacterium]|nr:hypothetical protein [Bacteroidota bacterium]
MPKTQQKETRTIDRLELWLEMRKNRITQSQIANRVKPRVTQKAVSKALIEGSRFLLPKIDNAIKEILSGKK